MNITVYNDHERSSWNLVIVVPFRHIYIFRLRLLLILKWLRAHGNRKSKYFTTSYNIPWHIEVFVPQWLWINYFFPGTERVLFCIVSCYRTDFAISLKCLLSKWSIFGNVREREDLRILSEITIMYITSIPPLAILAWSIVPSHLSHAHKYRYCQTSISNHLLFGSNVMVVKVF